MSGTFSPEGTRAWPQADRSGENRRSDGWWTYMLNPESSFNRRLVDRIARLSALQVLSDALQPPVQSALRAAPAAIGLAGAVGAAVAGLADWSDTEDEARHLGMAHALLDTAAVIAHALSLPLRRSERWRGAPRESPLRRSAIVSSRQPRFSVGSCRSACNWALAR